MIHDTGDRSANKPPERAALNGLRFLAALMVVVGHARALFFVDYGESAGGVPSAAFYGLTSMGHQAVIVFFVLSGYWVGGGAMKRVQTGRFLWWEYLIDRLSRLWVVLLPALVVTAAADAMGRALRGSADVYSGDASYGGIISEEGNFEAAEMIGNALFLQELAVAPFGSNQALWSLSYEFWFYLLFPALLLSFHRTRYAVVLAFALGLGSLFAPMILAYFPLWILGALLPALGRVNSFVRTLSAQSRRALAASSLTLLVVSSMSASIVTLPILIEDYLVAVVAAGAIVILAEIDSNPRDRRARGARWINARAHESFSLYATHLPILVLLVAFVIPKSSDRWSFGLGPLAAFLFIVASLLAIAAIFALFTERRTPLIRAFLRGFVHTRSLARFGRGRGWLR